MEPLLPKPNAAVLKETIKVLQCPLDLTQGKSSMIERKCSICHQFARIPYAECRYCGESQCDHHGGCCPFKRKTPLTVDKSEIDRLVDRRVNDALVSATATGTSTKQACVLQNLTTEQQQQVTAAAAEATRRTIEKETNRILWDLWDHKVWEKSCTTNY